MTYQSTLTEDRRPSAGMVARAAVVLAIVLVAGFYVLAQYTEQVARLLAKIGSAHSLAVLAATVAASVPASVSMLLLAFLVEFVFVGWDRSSLRKLATGNRHSVRDLIYAIFALLPAKVAIAVKVIFTFGIVWLTDRFVVPNISWNLSGFMPMWPLQYVAVVLVGSFFQYWQHRILHMVPVLWETHKLHHSALEMNVLNLHRESPFTTGVADLVIVVPLAIFGAKESFQRGGQLGAMDLVFMALFMSYSVFNVLNHYLIHSEMPTTYGWFGRWIFISPRAHRVHHSKLTQFWDKNFSVNLVIWDRLFGTWVEGDTEEALSTPLGFKDNVYNEHNPMIAYYWLPMRECARACVKLARGEVEFIRRTP